MPLNSDYLEMKPNDKDSHDDDAILYDDEAIMLWHKAADQGNADAQITLEDTYMLGKGGVEKDYKEAVKWFRKAAEASTANPVYS